MKLPKGIDRTPEKQKLFMDVLVEGWMDRQRRIFLKDGWIDTEEDGGVLWKLRAICCGFQPEQLRNLPA